MQHDYTIRDVNFITNICISTKHTQVVAIMVLNTIKSFYSHTHMVFLISSPMLPNMSAVMGRLQLAVVAEVGEACEVAGEIKV